MNRKTLIVVTGGRDYDNGRKVEEVLDGIVQMFGTDILLISGGARGLDTLALGWAYDREINAMRVPAKWKTDGMKAGVVRNGEMIEMARTFWRDGWNVMFIAFPGGNGTANMKMRMKNALHTFEDSAEGNGKNWVRFNEVYA